MCLKFSQCTFALNGVNITQSVAFITIGLFWKYFFLMVLTHRYRISQTATDIRMWGMLPCDPTKAESRNTGFIDRWKGQKQSKEIETFRRIHSDICNVPKSLLPGIKLQIKFTKAKPSFHLMNTAADSKTTFKFLDAKLFVRRIRANPQIPLAHEETLKTDVARYNLTRVELKTFTSLRGRSHSRSIRRSWAAYPKDSCSL